MHGFFVARAFLLPEAIPSCDKIEVAHRINTDWTGAEVGVSWFFHAPGSGIFLSCSRLPKVDGRIVAYTRRTEISHWPDPEGGKGLSNFMDTENIAMLVITEADYVRACLSKQLPALKLDLACARITCVSNAVKLAPRARR